MMSSTSLQAFHLNNQACSLIARRRYGDAATMLRRALLLTKREMEVMDHKSSPCSRSGGGTSSRTTVSPASTAADQASSRINHRPRHESPSSDAEDQINNDNNMVVVAEDEGEKDPEQSMESLSKSGSKITTIGLAHRLRRSPSSSSSHYIYSEPVIMSDRVMVGRSPSQCYSLCSFAITFNLALANHLKGVELHKSLSSFTNNDANAENMRSIETASRQHMYVARCLYELTIQIEDVYDAFGSHLHAAILNNLSDVCPDRQTSLYYDQLLLSVLFAHVGTGRNSPLSPLAQAYYHKFFENLSYLVGGGNATAPAA